MAVGITDLRNVLARSALLMLLAASMLFLPELTTDPGLRAILPGCSVLLFLYFAPALWTRSPDLFEPPVYTGIIIAFNTAATMADWIVNDELTLELVRGARTDELVGYAQAALVVLILG